MLRLILFIAVLLIGQLSFGQTLIYGNYKGSGSLLDFLDVTFHLSLQQDGSYTLKSMRESSSKVENGKWRQKGDKVKLMPKFSETEKQYELQRTFMLNIEGESLVWKPNLNKRRFEKEMSKAVGEKVTLVDKSEPLILHKGN